MKILKNVKNKMSSLKNDVRNVRKCEDYERKNGQKCEKLSQRHTDISIKNIINLKTVKNMKKLKNRKIRKI